MNTVYVILIVLAISIVVGVFIYGTDLGDLLLWFGGAIFAFGIAIAFFIAASQMGQFWWIGVLLGFAAFVVGSGLAANAFSIARSGLGG